MNKTLQTIQYLVKSFSGGILFGCLIILSTIAVTDLVYFLTDRYNTVHPVVSLTVPFEATTGIFALFFGLALFIADFKVTLANGISRKTFLLSNLPTAAIAAAAFAVFTLAAVKVHGLFWPIHSISEEIYPQIGWGFLLIFQFTQYFLLITAGRLIALAYYRSSVPVKWALSLAPLVLFLVLQQDNIRGGAITNEIRNYLSLTLSNPYKASISMLAYAILACGLIYLLIRRAPLKDE